MRALVAMFRAASAELSGGAGGGPPSPVACLVERMLWLTLAVWALFPLVWMAGWCGAMGLGAEQVAWGLADYLAKVVFSRWGRACVECAGVVAARMLRLTGPQHTPVTCRHHPAPCCATAPPPPQQHADTHTPRSHLWQKNLATLQQRREMATELLGALDRCVGRARAVGGWRGAHTAH
jgi:hypothetical protein